MFLSTQMSTTGNTSFLYLIYYEHEWRKTRIASNAKSFDACAGKIQCIRENKNNVKMFYFQETKTQYPIILGRSVLGWMIYKEMEHINLLVVLKQTKSAHKLCSASQCRVIPPAHWELPMPHFCFPYLLPLVTIYMRLLRNSKKSQNLCRKHFGDHLMARCGTDDHPIRGHDKGCKQI
jgi:hypothetical protein